MQAAVCLVWPGGSDPFAGWCWRFHPSDRMLEGSVGLCRGRDVASWAR